MVLQGIIREHLLVANSKLKNRKMKIKTLFIAIMLFCAIGNLNAQESQSQPITLSALFEYPTVPEDIEDWTERNNWLIENFWNNFNFNG